MTLLRALMLLVLGVAGAAGPACAADVPPQAATCNACHGAAGVPTMDNAPVLWGQTEGYIYIQLRDIKNNVRASPLMHAIAAELSRDEMFALAKYFAAQPWPHLGQPSAPPDVARAALVANGSIGCTGCHLANYQGNSAIPRLAGQKQSYLLETMEAFRTRARGNNPGMSDLMNAASPEDLKALAAYLAGL